MPASISAKIAEGDKERIKLLVKKGTFQSMSEFYRAAISRFLKELEQGTEEKKNQTEKDMNELKEFADKLF